MMPDIFDYQLTDYQGKIERENSVWPFSIRWSDLNSFQTILNQRSGADYQLVILGSVGANPLGIRSLAMIAEAASTLEIFRQNNAGTPRMKILYPFNINSWANGSDAQKHQLVAENHFFLAQKYFSDFHPNLPLPQSTIDDPQKLAGLESLAVSVSDSLSVPTIKILTDLASKKSAHTNHQDRTLKSVAYFLAHYSAYGWTNHLFAENLSPNHIFLLPHSEALFQQMLEQEYSAVNQHIPLDYQGDNCPTSNLILFSRNIKTPPYYPHQQEPLLHQISQWPGHGQIFNHKGLNGLAKQEIAASLELIKEDIAGKTDELINLLKISRINSAF